MTDIKLLLRMKSTLERMLESEDEKHHVRIRLALSLVNGELSKSKPEINDITVIVGIMLQPIFDEHELPPFEF